MIKSWKSYNPIRMATFFETTGALNTAFGIPIPPGSTLLKENDGDGPDYFRVISLGIYAGETPVKDLDELRGMELSLRS